MRLEDVTKKKKLKTVIVSVRITKEDKRWMKKHGIRFKLLFEKALDELKEEVAKDGDMLR